MNTLNKAAIVALAVSAFSFTAYAAQEGKGAKAGEWASFQKVDADGNGMVSKEEAGSVQGLDFSKADRNSDGQLSKSEYEAAKKGQKPERKQEKSGSR
ncbi:hypothetical protein SVA_2309 [Sulfurifustis variabilis]|uniref:EF-hand domain-containing protein n=1 Tax=Sulfurifustis variabilis TaxID=1675686 RepID=A0A1B4V5P2_9GAMM|nr:EF-hand domain-containing protein [Sulfurifustis variabilis]BAU48859.1 hypothetical protein SVA_2309 [Sulfurifustis variabilis]